MKKSIISINKQIAALFARKENIQTKCPHTNVNKEHGASTGNYDPSNDFYWTNFNCLDCDKHWQEDGSK
jgi:hypothetical protein